MQHGNRRCLHVPIAASAQVSSTFHKFTLQTKPVHSLRVNDKTQGSLFRTFTPQLWKVTCDWCSHLMVSVRRQRSSSAPSL